MIAVAVPYAYALERHDRADEFRVDDQGRLILSTSLCCDVAIYAPGEWKSAVVQPNRGPDGKFVKRGS